MSKINDINIKISLVNNIIEYCDAVNSPSEVSESILTISDLRTFLDMLVNEKNNILCELDTTDYKLFK